MKRICELILSEIITLWLASVLACSAREAVTNSLETRVSAWPGKQADGSMLLPNQWSLRPTGRQIELRDFPVNIAIHPNGRFVAVLHSGHSVHVVTIVDLASEKIVSHANIDQSFYGVAFSRDGGRLFCSGAGEEVIHSFLFQNGNLTGHEEIRLRNINERGIPAGLAVDAQGRTLFAANLWGDRISRVDLASRN